MLLLLFVQSGDSILAFQQLEVKQVIIPAALAQDANTQVKTINAHNIQCPIWNMEISN